ncbi:hypothetical protein GL218_05839 [Daldinia childiae]|uniref:uncharacterized protein n=1 Tax=Daldinia childiae TaxID=326645 RepID=UPI0014486076|nr:uncharacterized protein GL218_05839 [Daldinia childiae]KAF3058688.1 hypothetical protein GL218_05839 [Daldinia childiae]
MENVPGGTGFPLLAQRITVNPDYEAFIFRKFDRLSARNLLHLESRLVYLEYKLDQADKQAALGSDNETRRSIRAWEAFEQNSKDETRPEHDRMKMVEEVSERLKEYHETEHINENHVTWVTTTISTVVAAILLLGAIVLLRLLDQDNAQLGMIALFTVLFAGSVAVLTNARRTEIFAATAAYAAVLVVFVSSPSSNHEMGNCTCEVSIH